MRLSLRGRCVTMTLVRYSRVSATSASTTSASVASLKLIQMPPCSRLWMMSSSGSSLLWKPQVAVLA